MLPRHINLGLFLLPVEIFKTVTDESGELQVKFTEFGRPSLDQMKLRALLKEVKNSIEKEKKIVIKVPATEAQQLETISSKFWMEYQDHHPFLPKYVKMELYAYYTAFLKHVYGSKIHPVYTPTLRNGRTSCSNPPMQQTPR